LVHLEHIESLLNVSGNNANDRHGLLFALREPKKKKNAGPRSTCTRPEPF
jgi:hypothetical protein